MITPGLLLRLREVADIGPDDFASFAMLRIGDHDAREILAAHGIPIVAERVEHNGGLRLFFESWTGTVWVRVHEKKGTP